MAKRHQHVEHAILTLVLKLGDDRGYATTLPTLTSILREKISDILDREIVDTLKRLEGKHLLALSKYSGAPPRLLRYPDEMGDDGQFFYAADFRMERTPDTDPYVQGSALEINPLESPVTPPLDEDSRKRLFARLERLGLDRVKADLVHNMGRHEVGGTPDVREAAWEWVRTKEAEATGRQRAPVAASALIAATRIDELRKLPSGKFDFRKLVRLCEEINIAYNESCFFATAMLIRAVLDHVPPIFGKARNFDEVVNHHGGKSFKGTMRHLNEASRSVADGHLHDQISTRVTLPTLQQVNSGQQLDVLLAEIVRTMS